MRFERGVTRRALELMAFLEKRAVRKANRVFVPSDYAASTLSECYGVPREKISIMHNGIFFDEWTAAVDGSPTEKSPPTVLCVARLYRRKGIDSLIRAWPGVKGRIKEARLLIAGGGLEYENLLHLRNGLGLSDGVHFLGDVRSRAELASLYANCDVFCLPSRHETFGLVFLEAMSAGKPVVALESTAVPEVVRDGKDGILVKTEEPGELAETITFLLENQPLRARMGLSAKERVKAHFDWTKVVTPLIEWMEEEYAHQ